MRRNPFVLVHWLDANKLLLFMQMIIVQHAKKMSVGLGGHSNEMRVEEEVVAVV